MPFLARDHPRACGEQREPVDERVGDEGSSPRVRGAVGCKIYPEFCGGIIPARAGSSPRLRKRQSFHWDHPRACGEQVPFFLADSFIEGSSPRVRGAALWQIDHSIDDGIIPARAGSSYGLSLRPHSTRDHPRACGEQTMTHWKSIRLMGSSPRVRGAA